MNSLAELTSGSLLKPLLGLLASPGMGAAVTLLLGAVMLLVLHRHNVLSYGSERDTAVPELFFAAGLFLTPYTGSVHPLLEFLFALVLIHAAATVLLSYALKRSPFVAFAIGFWTSVMTVVHPVCFLFLPYFPVKLARLKLLTPKHLSAFLMAVAGAWWTALVLFAVPSLGGLWSFLRGRFLLIASPRLPFEGQSLFFALGLLVLLISFSAKVYLISHRSIARHKWVMTFQIGVSWLAFAAFVPYSRLSFLAVVTLFFLSSILRHIVSESNERDNRPGWLFLTGIALGLGLMVYSHLGNPPSLTLFS